MQPSDTSLKRNAVSEIILMEWTVETTLPNNGCEQDKKEDNNYGSKTLHK